MSGEFIRVTKVEAPTDADRMFSFGKPLSTKVTFAISAPGAVFDIAVRVDGRIDDGDVVTAARHELQRVLAHVAGKTSQWALTPEWFSERLPSETEPDLDQIPF